MEPKDRTLLEGIVEEIVREARFVDAGFSKLRDYERNIPISSIDRRRFLTGVGACLALYSLGFQGCATVQHEGQTYENWQAHLMKQDLIFGPELARKPRTLELMDFDAHLRQGTLGGVDYDVPEATPVVPAMVGIIYQQNSIGGGVQAIISTRIDGVQYNTLYSHLSNIMGKSNRETGNRIRVDLTRIIAHSGNSGDPGGNKWLMPYHLHFSLTQVDSKLKWIMPGLDPFKYGAGGGKPVYWDCAAHVLTDDFSKNKQRNSIEETVENLPNLDIDERTRENY